MDSQIFALIFFARVGGTQTNDNVNQTVNTKLVTGLMYDVTGASDVIFSKHGLEINNTLKDVGSCLTSQIVFTPKQITRILNKSHELYRFWSKYGTDNIEKNFSVSFILEQDTFNQMIQNQCKNNGILKCKPAGVFYNAHSSKEYYKWCPHAEPLLDIQYSLDYVHNETNVGLEYSTDYLEHCSHLNQELLKVLDFAILRIEFYPTIVTFSYPLFEDRVKRMLNLNTDFFQKVNPRCQIYVRLSLYNLPKSESNYINVYRAFMANYARRLIKNSQLSNVILDSYPSNMNIEPFKYNEDRKIENFHLFLESSNFYSTSMEQCQFRKLMEMVGKNFQKVTLAILEMYQQVPLYELLFSKCNETGRNPSDKANYPNISFIIYFYPVQNLSKLMEIINLATAEFTIDTVYVNFPGPGYLEKRIETCGKDDCEGIQRDIVQKFADKQIKTGCFYHSRFVKVINFTAEMEEIHRECSILFSHGAHLLLLSSQIVNVNEYQTLHKLLIYQLKEQKGFREIFQNGTIDFVPNVRSDFERIGSKLPTWVFRNNLFCSAELITQHEFNEIIINWGFVYNVSMAVQPLLDNNAKVGWWYNIETVEEVNRTSTNFPVFVRRNVPASLGKFANTFSCINYTSTPVNAINFVRNQFAGLTLDLTNTKVPTKSELQIMLLLALEKFSFVELNLCQTPLRRIKETLTSTFIETIQSRKTEVGNLYLYLESNHVSKLANDLKWMNKNFGVLKLRLHVSNWKNLNDSDIAFIETELTKQANIQLGLTVNNCIQEANSNLWNLRNLPFNVSVSYIVCQDQTIIPSNADKKWVQLYLDTRFYLQKYYNTELNVTLIFRQNFQTLKCDESTKNQVQNYLTFINDMNQYSIAYKVHFLMGNAFRFIYKAKQQCFWGWWNVSGNTANPQSYIEHESAYFGRPPVIRFPVDPVETAAPIWTIIGSSLGLMLLLGILMVVGFRWRYTRMKNRFLTKEEVRAFRESTELVVNEELVGEDQVNVSTIKTLAFNPKFEIAMENVELGQIIGRGNFGIVYRGILNNVTHVAVKTQTENCTVESFKTMLAEIKILCYVGSHPNIVGFLGAYTKEIKSGLVFVITEFCEGGSLEAFLKKLNRSILASQNKNYSKVTVDTSADYVGYVSKPTFQPPSEPVNVNLSQLRKFCYEVALGMEYISEKKIVHSDLSARNVLLTGENSCKICDFGLARKLYSYKYMKKGDEAMPWRWMAIESLKNMEFTIKSDVWSYGVTMWEIFSLGEVPYPGVGWSISFCDDLNEGLRLLKPPRATNIEYEIMQKCWEKLPCDRVDFCELVNFWKQN